MTNHRNPLHMHERFATEPARAGAAVTRTCAFPGCGPAVGVLCERHWFELPWSVRNSVGPAHTPPLRTSRRQVRALVAALREKMRELDPPTMRATTQLSPAERRFRPEALRILEEHEPRPTSVAECDNRGRQMPCPYISCPNHLYLDVTPSGSIHFNFPGLEPWELEETCVEEVVRKNPNGLPPTKVGKLVGLKRGRVGQVERKYRHECERRGLSLVDD